MKYQLFIEGRWRPITTLLRGQTSVGNPFLADGAVVYYREQDGYAYVRTSSEHIFEMPPESRPSVRFWTPMAAELPPAQEAPPKLS